MEIKRYDSLPQEAKDIREKVFVEEQGFKEEFDAADGLSVHLVAFDCGKPVATCRFYRKADTASFVLGRIAVVKECRGRHIGARLIAYAEDMLKTKRILFSFTRRRGCVPFTKSRDILPSERRISKRIARTSG